MKNGREGSFEGTHMNTTPELSCAESRLLLNKEQCTFIETRSKDKYWDISLVKNLMEMTYIATIFKD